MTDLEKFGVFRDDEFSKGQQRPAGALVVYSRVDNNSFEVHYNGVTGITGAFSVHEMNVFLYNLRFDYKEIQSQKILRG